MGDTIPVPVDGLIGLLAFIVQMGCVFGVLFIWGGRMDQRLKAVESHADTVQKIGPLEARFEQFERGMDTRLENIERAVREGASAMQQLALALATVRRTA